MRGQSGLVCLDVSICRGGDAFPGGPKAHLRMRRFMRGHACGATWTASQRATHVKNSSAPILYVMYGHWTMNVSLACVG